LSIKQQLTALTDDSTQAVNESTTACVYAYSDDTNIACSPSQVKAVCDIIQKSFSDLLLELVPRKCSILWNGNGDLDPENVPFPIINTAAEDSGRILVGNPIGGVEYRVKALRQIALQKARVLPALSKLRSGEAFTLMKHCINPRMGYCSRVNHPDIAGQALRLFDASIDRSIFQLCSARGVCADSPLDKHHLRNITEIRDLPLELGGLALVRHSGLTGEHAYLCSHALVGDAFRNYFDFLTPTFHAGPPVWLGYNSGLPQQDITSRTLTAASVGELRAPLFVLRHNLSQNLHKRLLDMDGDGNFPHAGAAALYANSIFEGSGAMFDYNHAFIHNMESTMFKEILRARLLINPVSDMVGEFRCGCGLPLSAERCLFHYGQCSLQQPQRTRRHTNIKSKTADIIRTAVPESCTITMEPRLPVGSSYIAGDLLVFDASKGIHRVVDFMVSDPAAVSNLTQRSYDDPSVVLNHIESVKSATYANTEWARSGSIVPFAITSTGRIGKLGLAFLQLLKDTYELPGSFIKETIREIGFLCAKSNAIMNIAGRVGSRALSYVADVTTMVIAEEIG
jgi:hypothetical protein